MLKREIIRIGMLFAMGFLIALSRINQDAFKASMLIVMPLHVIGVIYAFKMLLKALSAIFKTYFSYQALSLLTKPLIGTILCVLILWLVLFVVIKYIWLIGVARALACLWRAYQLDLQINANETQENLY